MERLKERDLSAILEFMRGAYGAGSLADYARHITGGLGRLIGANYVSYNEVDLRHGKNTPVVDPPEAVHFRGYTDGIFERHLAEHPIVAHFVRTGSLAAVKISDFVSRKSFHDLGIYQEFFRHVRTEHQLAAGVVAGGDHLIDIGVSRTRPDFTERDRTVLDIVRVHLAYAHETVRRLAAVDADVALLLEGTEEVDAGLVLLRPDGRIRLVSALARRLIEDYFGRGRTGPDRLPEALDRWVRSEERVRARHVPARARPLTVDRGDRRLVVRLIAGPHRTLLLLTEELLDLQPGRLEPLGLSRREAEVLCWVAQGKTDAEVAAILGARPRTIGKHLERIYQKLGVENRTMASARAFEAAAPRPRVR